jgi:hypothetical protein
MYGTSALKNPACCLQNLFSMMQILAVVTVNILPRYEVRTTKKQNRSTVWVDSANGMVTVEVSWSNCQKHSLAIRK